MKLEELLNKLIERGWEPRWHINYKICKYNDMLEKVSFNNKDYIWLWEHSLRELVSKESWLWQFVCENNLNYSEDDSIYNVWLKHYAEDDHESPYTYASPVWYLIESSLKDESELEDFLLSNINVDEK